MLLNHYVGEAMRNPLVGLTTVNRMLVSRWAVVEQKSTPDSPHPNQEDLDQLLAIINRDKQTVARHGDITSEYTDVLALKYDNTPLVAWFLKGGYKYVQKNFPRVNEKFKEAINLYRDQIPGISDEDIESGQAGQWLIENSKDTNFCLELLIRRWSHAPDIQKLLAFMSDVPVERVSDILGLEYNGSTLAHWFLTTDYAELARHYPKSAIKIGYTIYETVTTLDDHLGCKEQFELWKTNILRALVTQSQRDEASLLKHQWGVLKMHSKTVVKELLLHLELNPTLVRNWWDRLTQSLSGQDHKVVLNADLLDTLYYALDIPGRGVTLEEVSKIYLGGGNCDEKFGARGEKRYRSLSTIVNLCKSEEDIQLLSCFLKSPNIEGQYAESGVNYDRVIRARTQLGYMETQVADIINHRSRLIQLVGKMEQASSLDEVLSLAHDIDAPLIEDALLYQVFTRADSFDCLHNKLLGWCWVYDQGIQTYNQKRLVEIYYHNQSEVRVACDNILDQLLINKIHSPDVYDGSTIWILETICSWYQPSASFVEYMHENFPPEAPENNSLYEISFGYGQNRRPLRQWPKSESSPQRDAKPRVGFVIALFNSIQDMFSKVAKWLRSRFEFKKTGQNYQPSVGLSREATQNPVFDGDSSSAYRGISPG